MVGNLLTKWLCAVVVVPPCCFLVPAGYNERFLVAGLKPRWQTTIHWHLLTKMTSNYKLSNYLTNQMIPWSRAHLGKLTVPGLFKKYPTFCGKQKFTTILTTGCHSLINSVYTLPAYFFKIRFNIILPPKPKCSKCSLSFIFLDQNSDVPHAPPTSSSSI